MLLGTVSYLSPEQVERGVADTRSDVYAAGLLLFEMLTGSKAVTGTTPIQIAYNHVHGSIVAPSTLVPAVPAVLDDLVDRATAVEPDDRFDSATAFVTALREVRRSLSSTELDRRATGTDREHTTAMPAPVSSTTRFSPAGRAEGSGSPEKSGTPEAAEAAVPERHRTRPTAVGAAALTGLPVHDDGPVLEHTAAMPVGRRGGGRSRWPRWLAAVLIVAGASFGGWWFTAGPGGSTVVPTVVGEPLSRAEGELQRASLSLDTVEEFSEGKAQGVVLRVEPGAGSELAKDSTVRVVVSKGKERYAVPTLVGVKVGDTGAALSPLTLRLGDTSQAWSETVPVGVVISQDPTPGASVKRNTAVSVVISKGRRPIEVPTVTGASFEAASATISKAGLTVQRGDDVNSDTVPAGQVVSQSPANGTLHQGDSVTLVVSKGPVMVPVPNVVGRSSADAEKALTDLGFTVKKEAGLFGPVLDLVQHQSVNGGDSAPKGSTIVLTVV